LKAHEISFWPGKRRLFYRPRLFLNKQYVYP
jgi:hypothetical protein